MKRKPLKSKNMENEQIVETRYLRSNIRQNKSNMESVPASRAICLKSQKHMNFATKSSRKENIGNKVVSRKVELGKSLTKSVNKRILRSRNIVNIIQNEQKTIAESSKLEPPIKCLSAGNKVSSLEIHKKHERILDFSEVNDKCKSIKSSDVYDIDKYFDDDDFVTKKTKTKIIAVKANLAKRTNKAKPSKVNSKTSVNAIPMKMIAICKALKVKTDSTKEKTKPGEKKINTIPVTRSMCNKVGKVKENLIKQGNENVHNTNKDEARPCETLEVILSDIKHPTESWEEFSNAPILITSTPEKTQKQVNKKLDLGPVSLPSPLKASQPRQSGDSCYALFYDVCQTQDKRQIQDHDDDLFVVKRPRKNYSTHAFQVTKKTGCVKTKKQKTEEAKLEEWAKLMNSHFEDVEKSDLCVQTSFSETS